MRRPVFPFIVLSFLFVLLAGCPIRPGGGDPEKESPNELFEAANKAFQAKSYAKAADLFERLKSGHADFENMPEVYMKIGDCFFEREMYERAISEYLQFVELYPTHDDVARAQYMIGMSYFKQIKNYDLDGTAIERALMEFNKIRDPSSDNDWKKKAEQRYEECRKKIAEKEMYKARFYVKRGNYKAAKTVAQRILNQYAGLGFDDEAKQIVKKAEQK